MLPPFSDAHVERCRNSENNNRIQFKRTLNELKTLGFSSFFQFPWKWIESEESCWSLYEPKHFPGAEDRCMPWTLWFLKKLCDRSQYWRAHIRSIRWGCCIVSYEEKTLSRPSGQTEPQWEMYIFQANGQGRHNNNIREF